MNRRIARPDGVDRDPALESCWRATLDGVSITAVRADPATDSALIHSWMNRPHVVPWWQLDRPLPEIRTYLESLTHLMPWIVAADGEPFGYVETYRVADDPLAAAYEAADDDVGWHVLVGPQRFIGTGIPRLLGRAVLAYLLQHGNRAVCEPDVRNTRMLAFCRRIGCTPLGEVDLADKRAALMACDRAEFRASWPHDQVVMV